jgi:hypothetical protein
VQFVTTAAAPLNYRTDVEWKSNSVPRVHETASIPKGPAQNGQDSQNLQDEAERNRLMTLLSPVFLLIPLILSNSNSSLQAVDRTRVTPVCDF